MKPERRRLYLNNVDQKFRDRYALDICHQINKLIESGVDPKHHIIDTSDALTIVQAVEKMIQIRIGNSRKERSKFTFKSQGKRFLEWIKMREIDMLPVQSFNKTLAMEYLDYLSINDIRGRTWNNYLADARTNFEEIRRRELILVNPFADIPKKREGDKLRDPFTHEQLVSYAEFLKANNLNFYICSCLCFYAAIRPSEIVRLKVKHINMELRYITMTGAITKNSKQQVIPIFDEFHRILKDWGIDKLDGEMYLVGSGLRPNFTHTRSIRISDYFRKLMGILGYGMETQFYSLKDTMAIQLVQNGHDIRFIQYFLRHSDLETTAKYLSKYRPVINIDTGKVIPQF